MKDYCVRIKSHPVWAIGGNLRRQTSQAISQWRVESAERISKMDALAINQAVWRVFWRTIINGTIVLAIISLAIYSGYLKYQFPDPQHLDIWLLASAVLCNILLTQLLNFKYLKTILSFSLLLGSLIIAAWIVPFFDRMLMYVYTSWLLIFMLPITYWLTITAFDLHRFRNLLISIVAIISTFFYSLYPIQQFINWQTELDLLTIANRVSFSTMIGCLAVFTIFSTLAKILQLLPRIGLLFLKEIAD
jgi:hypothetical protein